MEKHKREIFQAWSEHKLSGYEGNRVDLLQGRPPRVLGGAAVVRQVRKLLVKELALAQFDLEASRERRRGAEWWERYVEGPAETVLRDSLVRGVPRRANETDSDYDLRLHRIELRMRARLPSYERTRPRGAPP